jgi:hypothetical protein
VDRVALGQDFPPVLRFSLVRVIPPVVHSHLYLNTVLINSLETLKTAVFFQISGIVGQTVHLFIALIN